MPISEVIFPKVFLIGGQRCGSSSLRLYLNDHNGIFAPVDIEPNFFNSGVYKPQGLEQYISLFSEAGECLRVDISPTYMGMYPEEVQFLKEVVPNAKAVLVIRNPIDRIMSVFSREWTYGHLDGKKNLFINSKYKNIFLYFKIESGRIRRLSNFHRTIIIWKKVFNQDDFFIVSYDRYKNDQKWVLGELFRFIEVSSGNIQFEPKSANVSKINRGLSGFLEYYIAKDYHSNLIKLYKLFPDPDVKNWINIYEKIIENGKKKWFIARLFLKIIYGWPYQNFYFTATALRRVYRVLILRWKAREYREYS